MCKIWEDIRQDGKNEQLIESIKEVLKNSTMTIIEAMNLLGIPESEHDKYKKLVLK